MPSLRQRVLFCFWCKDRGWRWGLVCEFALLCANFLWGGVDVWEGCVIFVRNMDILSYG